jgi:hypothetical protein
MRYEKRLDPAVQHQLKYLGSKLVHSLRTGAGNALVEFRGDVLQKLDANRVESAERGVKVFDRLEVWTFAGTVLECAKGTPRTRKRFAQLRPACPQIRRELRIKSIGVFGFRIESPHVF